MAELSVASGCLVQMFMPLLVSCYGLAFQATREMRRAQAQAESPPAPFAAARLEAILCRLVRSTPVAVLRMSSPQRPHDPGGRDSANRATPQANMPPCRVTGISTA
jgi:hypothetical protein